MAKESFFIRASITQNGVTFTQASIDLGAFVDALDRNILRIKQITAIWSDGNGVPLNPATNLTLAANSSQALGWQLTTQSQSSMVEATDRSKIASGSYVVGTGASSAVTALTQAQDMNVDQYANGYLIGVEQIYVGFDAVGNAGDSTATVNLVLECEVTKLTAAASMALALSQQ